MEKMNSQAVKTAEYMIAPAPKIIKICGGAVEYVDFGETDSPVVFALHGGMGGYDHSWFLARSLIADFSSHRIIALSRPGYLGTSQSLGRTPEEQADFYAHFLNALAINKALVVAVSAGGPSAIHFALRHPVRCTGLILVSCATGPLETAHSFLSRLRKIAWLSRAPGLMFLFRRRIANNPSNALARSIGDPVVAAKTLEHPIAGPLVVSVHSSAFSRVRSRLPGTLNDTERLLVIENPPYSRISAPVLVIHGEADDVVPNSHARQLIHHLPSARNVMLPGAGHMALFTHMEAIKSAVADFL